MNMRIAKGAVQLETLNALFAFADDHDALELEFSNHDWARTVRFKNVSVSTNKRGNNILIGAYGRGETWTDAMCNYAEQIQGHWLWKRSHGKWSIVVKAPRLTPTPGA